ncbi:hypothetical protein I5677_08665 [Mobilitalea sibirica]|uniref:Uncharacterized protein n=1 Tax=Mobilitalea sibirica TaxID=1462919 RepID=A0A8J7KW54_9FIRM|nr:hypothetical protein [Mobilitalea sibirica]MBH1940960.1 hypothetical protein [Mobilitalea sibirica]
MDGISLANLAISVYEKIRELIVGKKNFNNQEFTYFEEIFDDMKIITDDYLRLLHCTLEELNDYNCSTKIIKNRIEEKRIELFTLRERIRGFVSISDDTYTDEMTLFIKGIMGVLKGGASIAIENGHAITKDYGMGDHTILDIINKLENIDYSQGITWRNQIIQAVEQQKNAIQLAWKDICKGFALIEKKYK